MSNLWDHLKAQQPRREKVCIEGQELEVRGMLRSQKNQLVADCTSGKDLDNNLLESRVLAWCIVEPGTDSPVQSNASAWDEVSAEITGPLVRRCIKLCGFDDSELVADAAGKSEPTGSSG